MNLIPITGKNLIEKWGFFTEGMDRLMKYGKNDENISMIYNDILAGNALLWAGFIDKKYSGFIVTQVMQAPFEEKRLLIRAIYSNGTLNGDIYTEGFKVLDDFCRQVGAKKMEFYTPRDKAFERKLKDYNWKSKQVIFEREVSESENLQ